ncbi:hypothetical protein HY030_00535, partial [Candidatus Gottesmanbacteria bacterium]|nr:hypothetical protein [Candidatus Gottesmanbacteria bacterium]
MNPFIGDIDKKVSIGDAVEAVLTSYGINPMRVEGRLPVDGTAKYMFRLLLIG